MLIGQPVADYIKKVLERNEYPEKNYRACQGIINFKKRVGNQGLSMHVNEQIALMFTIMG